MHFYQQAVSGQLSLLTHRRDVDAIMADKTTTVELRERLALALDILAFAEHLGLPADGTFESYVALEKPFVVWNVFAAQEFSTSLENNCFPIAGCVGYKGFFNEDDAMQYQATLIDAGYETHLGGVAAYSTLGWFSDPLLSSFIFRDDEQLAALIFHELAHKITYVAGDTTFNESFATVVSQYALERWLAERVEGDVFTEYLESQGRQQAVIQLILDTRQRLSLVYEGRSSNTEKRVLKQELIDELRQAYKTLSSSWKQGAEFKHWMAGDINNAKLGTVGTYQKWVKTLEGLLVKSDSFSVFLKKVNTLSELNQDARIAILLKEIL